jgi:hypothetical protein
VGKTLENGCDYASRPAVQDSVGGETANRSRSLPGLALFLNLVAETDDNFPILCSQILVRRLG